MEYMQTTAQILRKVAIITLVGFLVVVLSGPVLTLVGALLPFALVGFVVWVGYRLVLIARESGWRGVGAAAGRVVRTALAVPLWVVARIFGLIRGVFRLVFGAVGFALRVLIPLVGGAF